MTSSKRFCKLWGPSISSASSSSMAPEIEEEPNDNDVTRNMMMMTSSSSEVRPSVMGFTVFLITTKTMTLLGYLVLLIISEILLDKSFFFTIFAFGIAELVLIALTVFHISRPTLQVVFLILGSELILGAIKFGFSIALEAIDGGEDCTISKCRVLQITEKERFGLFWFCLITAFYDYLTSLIIISSSPQMHEFEMSDKYLF